MTNPYEAPKSGSGNARNSEENWPVLSSKPLDSVAQEIADYFEAHGYRLESGSRTDGMYGIGNNLLRVFLGALIKRYRFHVVLNDSASGTSVSVEKGMSGALGGAIGYAKMQKELKRVRAEIASLVGDNTSHN